MHAIEIHLSSSTYTLCSDLVKALNRMAKAQEDALDVARESIATQVKVLRDIQDDIVT